MSLEQLVRSRIIQSWESHDEQEHLKTIRERIYYKEKEQIKSRLLGLYQQILQEEEITAELLDNPKRL